MCNHHLYLVSIHFFEKFLIFCCHKVVQDHLGFYLPQPWKSSFVKEPLVS